MAALLPYRRLISGLWPKCFRSKVRFCARRLAIDPPCLFANLSNQPESPNRVMRGISSHQFGSISSLHTAIALLHAKHFSRCLLALDFFQSEVASRRFSFRRCRDFVLSCASVRTCSGLCFRLPDFILSAAIRSASLVLDGPARNRSVHPPVGFYWTKGGWRKYGPARLDRRIRRTINTGVYRIHFRNFVDRKRAAAFALRSTRKKSMRRR